jgi:prophage regulatory protein
MAKHKTTPAPIPTETDERILTTEELLERVPLNRSTLWRMAREGRFPKPIQLTPARIGWRWSAVLSWLKDREDNPVEARAYFRRSGKAAIPNSVHHEQKAS